MSMRRVTGQLVVPMGFTLTASGVVVASLARWPQADFVAVWLFSVGAVGAHAALVLAFRVRPSAGRPLALAPRSWEGALVVNAVPVIAIPLAVLGSQWIDDARLGFLLGGALAVALYIAGLGGFLALLDRRHPTPRQETLP